MGRQIVGLALVVAGFGSFLVWQARGYAERRRAERRQEQREREEWASRLLGEDQHG